MKTYTIHLIAAAMACMPLQAQGAKPPVQRRPPPPLLLPVLDTDHNGELSAEEIANASASLLDLDKNGDGSLGKKEIAPPPKGKKNNAPKPPKGPAFLVKLLDTDEDHTLSADEIEDAPILLATLDKDGDGAVSKKELKPAKPPVDQAT